MKIALCHLELSMGPQAVNLKKLERALALAGEYQVEWVVTPETAVQGYHFYKIDPDSVLTEQPSSELETLRALVRKNRQYLFLGAGEYDPAADCNFNTCFIFGPKGELIGKHRKNHSHGYGGEAWVTNSTIAEPICCGSVCVGVMVCSDAWYPECSQRLKRQGAQILLDIAAWPVSKECGDPLPAWQRCSKETGLPMILCNQTGKTPWLDLSKGQSVYIEKGNAELTYNGEEALLLFEWDAATGRGVSERFTVIPFC